MEIKNCIHSYPDKKELGTHFYIHARNIASAVLFLINNDKIREKYNIAGEKEVSNLDLAKIIVKFVGKELKYEMIDFHSTLLGHDLRYGLVGTKLRELGVGSKV
jgi:dTDP-D-glucose 4,6-dehydratase